MAASATPNESTELVTVDETDEKALLAEYADYLQESDTHDAVPVAAPMLRWQHMGASALDKVGGKFYNSLEGVDKPYDELEAVFINGKNSRAYYAGQYDAKKVKAEGANPPDCKSNDGLVGLGLFGIDNPARDKTVNPTGKCGDCKMAQWSGKGRDADPPPCALSYDRLIWDAHTGQVGIMSFAKSKIKAITEFQRAIQARNGGMLPMWAYKVRMYSEAKDNFFVPKIQILGVMKREDALKFKQLKDESDAAFMRTLNQSEVTVSSVVETDDDGDSTEAAAGY